MIVINNCYCPLIAYSNYGTYYNSTLKIDDYINKAIEKGIDNLAITDINDISVWPIFSEKCKKNNIKAILGMTLELSYLTITIIAKNQKGINKIINIHNEFYKDNKDILNLLANDDNIICLTYNVDKEMIGELEKIIKNLYLVLIPGVAPNISENNEQILALAKRFNLKVVFTPVVKYPEIDDYVIQDFHRKISENKITNDKLLETDITNYLIGEDEIFKTSLLNDDIINIGMLEVKNIINEIKDTSIIIEPTLKSTLDDNVLLKLICIDMLCHKGLNNRKYIKRLMQELFIINQKGFSKYFINVFLYVAHARFENMKIGAGRGSACSSLIAYLLDITNVDPIKYDLMFERFLNIDRLDYPDIDIDIAKSDRDKLIDFIIKHNKNKTALLEVVNTRQDKALIRDMKRLDVKIHHNHKEKLKNLITSKSTHPSGIIISDYELEDKLPLKRKDNVSVITYNDKNLVKYDFLSSQFLDKIKDYDKKYKINFDYKKDELYEDNRVWDLICSGKTAGLFQISSKLYQERLPKIKPRNIKELAICLALIRPPSLLAGLDEKYINIKNNKTSIESIHPYYDEVTKETNGILLYQEQLLQLLIKFDCDRSLAYKIMKAGAKKDDNYIKENKDYLLTKFKNNNCNNIVANKLYEYIEQSAGYSFNKSHAIAYAMLSYESAYYKVIADKLNKQTFFKIKKAV